MTASAQSRRARRHLAVAIAPVDDPTDPGPARRATLTNALLPGAGLISAGRPWLGLGAGLAFWAPLTVALAGSWILPGLFSMGMTLLLTGVTIAAYLGGQVLLVRAVSPGERARRVTAYAAAFDPLMQAVYEALGEGDWIEAQIRLDRALAMDLANPEANLIQARLLAIQGKTDQAQRAYARCRRLDWRRRWAWEIQRELALLR